MNRTQKKCAYTAAEEAALRLCLDIDSGKIKKPVVEIMNDLRAAGGIERKVRHITNKIQKMGFSVAI